MDALQIAGFPTLALPDRTSDDVKPKVTSLFSSPESPPLTSGNLLQRPRISPERVYGLPRCLTHLRDTFDAGHRFGPW